MRPGASRGTSNSGRDTLWVQAVVVFWSDFPEQLVEDGKCVYIHGSRLKAWLAQRPEQLDPARVQEIATAIQRLAEE
jgi:hypothetical protein